MNLIQIVMTAVFSAIGYFLLVAFTAFEHRDMTFQLMSLGGIAVVSFLAMRKIFP